jgi:hypothetical protein
MSNNARYWVGMIASVLVALAGQAEVIPEPYRHVVSVLGIVGTAVTGYMIQRPVETETEKIVKLSRGEK